MLALGGKLFGEPDAAVVQRLGRNVDDNELRRLTLRVLDVDTRGELLER